MAKKQAELIADKFTSVSQEYEGLKKEDIRVPSFTAAEIPVVCKAEVSETLAGLDANKSNVKGNIPAKNLKTFSKQISVPMTDILNV